MELLKKSQNWWLKFTVVILFMVMFGMLAVQNRETSELQQFYVKDSLVTQRLTFQVDSLIKANDSLQTELFTQKTIVGRYELGLDFLKERRPNEHNLLMHYIDSQTE